MKSSLYGLAKGMDKVNSNVADDILVQVVTSHLREQERCLLVIDNLDRENFSPLMKQLVNGSWVRESKVSILVTSRLEENQLAKSLTMASASIILGSFNTQDGIVFLVKRTGRVFEDVDAQKLVLELGGLPLALDQVAAYLKMSSCTLH